MSAFLRFPLLFAIALFAAAPARATTPWLPAQGAYWNPSEHGIYYHVSVGPTGFVFVGITTYRADGEPTFLVMQGPFEPTSYADWAGSGVTGRLHSPLYRMSGGQCLGCAVRPSTTAASDLGDAEIEFRNDGRAVFRQGGRATPIEHYPLFRDASSLPRNRLKGRYQARFSGRTLAGQSEFTAIVDIGDAATGVVNPTDIPLLRVVCVDCSRSRIALTQVMPFFAADDGGALRAYGVECHGFAQICVPVARGIVHERDGTLFVRGMDAAHPYEITLQRMGAPCGQHYYDCEPSNVLEVPYADAWVPPFGLYWNAAEPGIYYHVSVGPGGYMLVAITLYDSAGEPTFLVMQGQYQPSSLDDSLHRWITTAEIGRLYSPLYRMAGGQCIGCAYRNPSVSPSSFGDAELVFFDGGRAEFHHGGKTASISTYPLYTDASGLARNRLQGRWVAVQPVGDVPWVSGIVDVVASDSDPRSLEARCVDCDVSLAATLGARTDIDSGREPFPLYVREGVLASELPLLELHERDGILYARTARERSSEFGNIHLKLLRIGPIAPTAPQ